MLKSFKSLHALWTATAVLLLTLTAQIQNAGAITAEELQARTFTSAVGRTLPYRLYVPPDYKPGQKYPVVLFLHGAGERGEDNLIQLRHRAPLTLIETSTTPFIFVAPQCAAKEQWVDTPWSKGSYSTQKIPMSDNLQMALELVDQLTKEFTVDTDRLYVTGMSMGGFGTWDAIMRRPEMFAAAIPICGGADPSQAVNLKGVGIWTFHSADDKPVPVSGTRDIIRALWSAGHNPSYVEFTSGGHNSWDRAYKTPGLATWLFSFSRAPKPPVDQTPVVP